MLVIGFLLFALGFCSLGWGFVQKLKARKIGNAPFSPTGGAIQRGTSAKDSVISTEGMAVCDQLLRAPISGTPCLYWEYKIEASWKETVWNESQKKTEEKRQSKTVEKEKGAARFALDDGSGPAPIDASGGGSLDLEKTFDEGRDTNGSETMVRLGQRAIPTTTAPPGASFSAHERVLKPAQRLYVCGKVTAEGRIGDSGLVARLPGMGGRLLISTKSRDQLLGRTQSLSKRFLAAGAAAAVIGMLLMVIAPATESTIEAASPVELEPSTDTR
jgi:hypothetical protein